MTAPARTHDGLTALARIAMALATALILWGTLWRDAPPAGPEIPYFDKLMHLVAFAAWAGLLRLAWGGPVWAVIAIGAGFGAAIELIQPLTGRQAELADLAADIAGCVIGVWFAGALRRLWPGRDSVTRG